MQQLQDWIVNNKLNVKKLTEKVYQIDNDIFILIDIKKDFNYEVVEDNEIKIIKEDLLFYPLQDSMYLIISDEEQELIEKYNVTHYLFYFGERFYYNKLNIPDNEIKKPKLFKYLGKSIKEIDINFCNLGVRSGYELLNGSGDFNEWLNKTNFLDYKYLGLADKNTLGGTLAFQIECKQKGIKSIIGETINIKREDSVIEGKVYVTNEKGWNNLLHINKCINVDNVENKYIIEKELFKLSEGLIFIFSTETDLSDKIIKLYKKQNFVDIYYQFDISEYLSDGKDKNYLLSIKNYLDNYISILNPVFISDSFYLDNEYSHIKKSLNNIGSLQNYQAKNQHYKNLDDIFEILAELFSEDKLYGNMSFTELFTLCAENTIKIAEKCCDFEIETKSLKLPEYSYEYEKKRGKELFLYLIEKGFKERIEGKVENEEIYRERIKEESGVILEFKLFDYFLTLWDINTWCLKNNIYVGLGRGSAAGSIVSYLLKITHVDPIKFNLLFSRFMNKGRLIGSLPDIDSDYPRSRRDDVKNYMIQRFGANNVCSVGSYNTLKVKAAFKDIGRLNGIDVKKINFVNSILEDVEEWFDIFNNSVKNKNIKDFVQNNFNLINDIQIVLNQPRSASIHASAVIITPNNDNKEIFDWIPLKKVDDVLISEWEGKYIEKAGFLKEDILGIEQLDKFRDIVDLIKETTGDEIDIYNLPLDDYETYKLFSKGFCEDVFQFGGGMIGYSIDVKPDTIEDLIAMNALYRPGPMELNYHNLYALIKHGKREPKYLIDSEDILGNTYGLITYQEQFIQLVSKYADFDEVTADIVRRATGKKDLELLQSLNEKFIEGAVNNGYNKEEMQSFWDGLEGFARYSFNRSHSVCYAITAYICQWLKANYPLQFYTVSLKYAKDDEISARVVEIGKIGNGIKLMPPDINNSIEDFKLDIKRKTIFWSLPRIKFMGDKALEYIIKERDKNGSFYSLEEFYTRVERKYCNRRVVKNLILSGAFDEVENIINPHERWKLIKYLYEITRNEENLEEDFEVLEIGKDYYWQMLQKQICGYGSFSFNNIIGNSEVFKNTKLKHIDAVYLSQDNIEREEVVVGGIISKVIERSTKNGPMGSIELLNLNDIIHIVFWNDLWKDVNKQIQSSKGKLLFFQGIVKFDSFKKKNCIYSYENSQIDIL